MFVTAGGVSLLLATATLAGVQAKAAHAPPAFPIVELRQYTLHPGKRDELIALFEREFVESQEALGMKIIGTFTDLDDPDRFVWLRGFKDMESRAAALTSFYTGPIWLAHREQANATMIDSDNVLLLETPNANAGFSSPATRPALGEQPASGLVVATIYRLTARPDEAASTFEKQMLPKLQADGVEALAWFVPEALPNNFPRLPVREGEKLFVWFAAFRDLDDYERCSAAIKAAATPIQHLLEGEPEVLKLKPTARSLIRGALERSDC
jgi:quinol monooxygenase YgiN